MHYLYLELSRGVSCEEEHADAEERRVDWGTHCELVVGLKDLG